MKKINIYKISLLILAGSLTLCSCSSNEISKNNDTIVIEEISTEQQLINYLNELYHSTELLVKSNYELAKEASISTSAYLIRFIEGTEQINGYTFDSLTENTKEAIITLLVNLKTLMTETYGDFYNFLTPDQQASLNNVANKLKNMKDATSKALEGPIEVVLAGGTAIVKNINETKTVDKVKTKTKETWNEIVDWANKQN